MLDSFIFCSNFTSVGKPRDHSVDQYKFIEKCKAFINGNCFPVTSFTKNGNFKLRYYFEQNIMLPLKQLKLYNNKLPPSMICLKVQRNDKAV